MTTRRIARRETASQGRNHAQPAFFLGFTADGRRRTGRQAEAASRGSGRSLDSFVQDSGYDLAGTRASRSPEDRIFFAVGGLPSGFGLDRAVRRSVALVITMDA